MPCPELKTGAEPHVCMQDVSEITSTVRDAFQSVREDVIEPATDAPSAEGAGSPQGEDVLDGLQVCDSHACNAPRIDFGSAHVADTRCHRAVAHAPARETDDLQAIDDQVDQLASAAGAALGSLWSGIGGAITSGLSAAGHVARQIEQVAQRAASPDKSPSPRWAAAKAASLCSQRSACSLVVWQASP